LTQVNLPPASEERGPSRISDEPTLNCYGCGEGDSMLSNELEALAAGWRPTIRYPTRGSRIRRDRTHRH
jgi:hypothetical protein